MQRSPQLLLFPFELTQEQIRVLVERTRKSYTCLMMTVSAEYKNHNICTWDDMANWLEQHPLEILQVALDVASAGAKSYKAVLSTFEYVGFDIEGYLKSMGIYSHE